jgi:hypothetical protein
MQRRPRVPIALFHFTFGFAGAVAALAALAVLTHNGAGLL